jgi:hypothetical protein
MAKEKAIKKETKSDFLRRVLSRNPNLTHDQVNQKWIKAGNPGAISNPLYYQIRGKLGIKTQWMWVREVPPAPKSQAPATQGEVYQFKITLLDTAPPIWRRIQVQDCSLDKLHEHIQTAMGWTNSHLHQFRIGEAYFGDPMLMEESFGDIEYKNSTTTLLSDILPTDGTTFSFEYEYDFGDSWRHEIRFEGAREVGPAVHSPCCVEGERACPPEDAGGVDSFAGFLEAIADPDHEEHDTLLEWVGGKFDPTHFKPAIATARMRHGLPDWRRMR